MKSIIQQDNLFNAEVCGIGRTEVYFTVNKNGRQYTTIVRDKLMIEDPYINLVKSGIFSRRKVEPYNAKRPNRVLRDYFIKQSST